LRYESDRKKSHQLSIPGSSANLSGATPRLLGEILPRGEAHRRPHTAQSGYQATAIRWQLYFSRRQIKASCFNAAEEFLAAVDRSERFDCVTSDLRGLSDR
jgi:hypothetical protein